MKLVLLWEDFNEWKERNDWNKRTVWDTPLLLLTLFRRQILRPFLYQYLSARDGTMSWQSKGKNEIYFQQNIIKTPLILVERCFFNLQEIAFNAVKENHKCDLLSPASAGALLKRHFYILPLNKIFVFFFVLIILLAEVYQLYLWIFLCDGFWTYAETGLLQ